MWEIIMKMLLCLLIAFILGFIVGWLLRSLFCKGENEKFESDLRKRDDELRGLRSSAASAGGVATAAAVAVPKVDTTFDDEYGRLRARLDELEGLATDDEEDTDQELQDWTAETEALRGKIATLKGNAKSDEAHIRVGGLDATALSLLDILRKAREDKAAGIAKIRRVGYAAGVRDDLKDILGVGPVLEKILNANDVYLFNDIANWNDADIDDMAETLGSFQGPRIRREDWVGQCEKLHSTKYGSHA